MLAEKLIANCVDDDEFPDPEKATIWYRCTTCSGYLFSIPELKRHSIETHGKPLTHLPENLPPEAEDGRIYYDYKLPLNKAPSRPYPFNILGSCNKPDFEPNDCLTQCKSNEPQASTAERDILTRTEQLNLQENATSEREENYEQCQTDGAQKRTWNAPSPAMTHVTSPPDSGIQMHDGGNEFPDDEGQAQPIAVIGNSKNPGTIRNENEHLTVVNDAKIPSKSTAPPSNESKSDRLKCPHCEKSFSNISSRNFHVNRFHKPGDQNNDKQQESEKKSSIPPEKYILTIRRDISTGDFSATTSSKNQAPKETSQNAKRAHSSDSEEEGASTSSRKKPNNANKENAINLNQESEHSPYLISTTSVPVMKRKHEKKPRTGSNVDNESASRSGHKNTYDSECEGSRTSTNSASRKSVKVTSSSSSEESDEDASKSEGSDILVKPKRTRLQQTTKCNTPEQKKMNLRRTRKDKAVESESSDSSDSPIARKTRSKTTKAKSPTPSYSESDSESFIVNDDYEENTGESEGELSDRSTTPDESIASPSPAKSDNGSKSNNKKTKDQSQKTSQNKTASSSEYSSSDLEDLFTPVRSKKRSKDKSKNDRSSTRSTKTSTKASSVSPYENEGTDKTTDETDSVAVSSGTGKVCRLCSRSFTNPVEYVLHLYGKHKNDDVPFSCGMCQKMFTTKQDLKLVNDHIKMCKDKYMKGIKKK